MFTITDVEKFKKGLSAEQAGQWVKIANSALEELTSAGTDELEAEIVAVRKANALFSDVQLSEQQLHQNNLRQNEEVRLVFAEAPDWEDVSEGDPGYQLILPVGLTFSEWYGDIIITRKFCDRIVQNQYVLKNTRPFLDTNHDRGASNGWLTDMRATDEGLEVAWDFTEVGKELLKNKIYKYYSATIYKKVDPDTGEHVWPVLVGCALTNSPVMKQLPSAHLSDTANNPAHGDGEIKDTEGSMKTFAEIMAALLALSEDERAKATDAQKVQLADLLGIPRETKNTELSEKLDLQKQRVQVLSDENKVLNTELDKLRKEKSDARKADVIEKALSEGRISPKNREKWENLFDKDPDGTAELLAEKGKEVQVGEGQGTGDSGKTGVALSETEAAFAASAGLTLEDLEEAEKNPIR